MCSCTIVSQDYLLARSSCIRNGTTGTLQVHAGALNSSNANQIIGASLLATSKPPPEGVVALKLDVQLSFTEYVSEPEIQFWLLGHGFFQLFSQSVHVQ